MADIARKTNDLSLLEACETLWSSITERQMYITGAIGSSSYGEAFSYDYDLPNDTVYGETCAAIGLVFFARRMLENNPDVRYADVMERALYNGIISGMSLDGKSFFYVNPLEADPAASQKNYTKFHVKVERQKWFGCSCCPPNVARLLASLGSYAYTSGDDGSLFMHLYTGGIFAHMVNSQKVTIKVDTRYPWDGEVSITVIPDSPLDFTYALRIPGWCSRYTIKLNGKAVNAVPEKGYIKLSREWKSGDSITINFDMPVKLNAANSMVKEDIGKTAVSRGPVVYCLEEADNGPHLHLLSVKLKTKFQVQHRPDLLGGVTVISGEGQKYRAESSALYSEALPPQYTKKQLTWIPYYAWANRGAGEMRVWIPLIT
jgi:DUF1680 family protein